jgi:hypothetical protein
MLLGNAFIAENGQKLSQENEKLTMSIGRFRYWYDLSLHKMNLPAVLQEWQEKQASTVVFPKEHKKFAIIPLS